MRGNPFHETLIDELDDGFRVRGFRTFKQAPCCKQGRSIRYVDLLATRGSETILIEVEMAKSGRVKNDLLKLQDFDARAMLLIVVPHKGVQLAIQRQIEELGEDENDRIKVLTLGDVLHRFLPRET